MSVSLFVGLHPYGNQTNIGIYPVLDEIYFWNFLEAFLEDLYTRSKYFWITCMSVSLLVGVLTYLNLANIGSSLVLDDISFWTFWNLSVDISGLFPNNFKFPVCLPVCYLAHFLTEINVGISTVLDETSFSVF